MTWQNRRRWQNPGALAPPLLGVLLLLAGCTGKEAGSVAAGLTAPFIQNTDVKTAAAEPVGAQSRGKSLGVVMNLGGPRETVRSQLGVGVVVFGTIPAPEVQRYVETIRDRLLVNWPYERPAGTPRVEITSQSGYGAESLADNTIQLPIGVMEQAQTDDEVAFVIGHELGHLVMKHQARREAALNKADMGIRVATLVGMVAATYALGTRVGNQVTVSANASRAIAGAGMGGQMAGAEILLTMVDPGWSRRQEEQADLIGVDLMTAAGYHPQYASQAFKSLEDEEKATEKQQDALKQAAATHREPLLKDGKLSLDVLVRQALSPIGNALRSLRVNHPDTASREAAVYGYRGKFYPAQSDEEGSSKELDRLRASRGYRGVVKAIAALGAADSALDAHDPQTAVMQAIVAHRLVPEWWAPSYVAGVAYLDAGDTRAGIRQLLAATDAAAAPYPVFERAAFELADSGDMADGMRVLDKAAGRFGGPDVTWPDRIELYVRANDKADAERVQKECLKSDNASLKEACGKTTFSSMFGT